MPGKVWIEIDYPFPNVNGATIGIWEWISKFNLTFHNGCKYLSMLGSKLNHVDKRGPASIYSIQRISIGYISDLDTLNIEVVWILVRNLYSKYTTVGIAITIESMEECVI